MNTIDDFIALVRDQLGLDVTSDNVGNGFDDLAGWDSVQLLTLLQLLERETNRRISLPDVLESQSLADVYALATGG
ncbi:MAG: acyl carrier protein [Streptomycetaceae bacterium]|nr:acyl carrier protein [Streptomycetaceae bacterium]